MKTEIWIAVAAYVLVAIVRKRLELDISLHQIVQILSVTLFEEIPRSEGFQSIGDENENSEDATS